ncbi:hypothetical protein E2C01_017413 [Portunus trituberculatus]|uniref:Uncharacterized protein n=1 Tax=Portunus trituberculatus TaxID=210409 RepID=A0A5B7DTK9_PORTR|nr:hypothetical protein [Portunus trituberculatus]
MHVYVSTVPWCTLCAWRNKSPPTAPASVVDPACLQQVLATGPRRDSQDVIIAFAGRGQECGGGREGRDRNVAVRDGRGAGEGKEGGVWCTGSCRHAFAAHSEDTALHSDAGRRSSIPER